MAAVTTPDPSTHLALRSLAERYARAADRGDVEGFLAVFEPDAVLRVHDPADSPEPMRQRQGHDALAGIPPRLRRDYVRTFHLVGNATYEIDADAANTATGEVYCLAHHLTADAVDRIMFIRYRDRYRRGDDGEWRIAERVLLVDWTERRPTDLGSGL